MKSKRKTVCDLMKTKEENIPRRKKILIVLTTTDK